MVTRRREPPPPPPQQQQTGDTIIAPASGRGRAGIAVLRVSGPQTAIVLARLCAGGRPASRRLTRRRVCDPRSGELLDEALVVWMPGPHSYTGEDVAEFHLHGASAVVEAVLRAAASAGPCRLAEPGEFTRRAVENGRIDMVQAEGIGDLIDAETEGQRRSALRLYDGEAARIYDGWRTELIQARASLEAGIDFADEADILADVALGAAERLRMLRDRIADVLADGPRARAVREGYRVAVMGPVNAGKSSLVNRLAGREAAIVSPLPGTTRDVVEIRLVLAGFPVWIADTAGLRDGFDVLEVEGIARARAQGANADLRLWVIDSTAMAASMAALDLQQMREGDFLVANKTDIAEKTCEAPAGDHVYWRVSARTGEGIEAVVKALEERVAADLGVEPPFLAGHARHCELLGRAAAAVTRALEGLAGENMQLELVAEDVRLASDEIGRLTGKLDPEDWLDAIFSRFCIGK